MQENKSNDFKSIIQLLNFVPKQQNTVMTEIAKKIFNPLGFLDIPEMIKSMTKTDHDIEREENQKQIAIELSRNAVNLEYIKQKIALDKIRQDGEIANKEIDAKILIEHLRQTEYTRRLVIVISAILLLLAFVLAIIVIIYVPTQKQSFPWWFGASIILLAAGAAGFKNVLAKSKEFQIHANQSAS